MFYSFRQNNSGGSFVGPINVIIEAKDVTEANYLAQRNGIYFDGVARGDDCPCCGDRWHKADEYDESEVPEHYGSKIGQKISDDMTYTWKFNAPYVDSCLIIYKDGRREQGRFQLEPIE